MKKLLLFTSMIFACSCVSNTKYELAIKTTDSLQLIINSLVLEVDDLKYSEERLLDKIDYNASNEQYLKAKANIDTLKLKHPHSKRISANSVKFDSIIAKADIEQQIIDKRISDSIRLANINKLGIWKIGEFVDPFDGKPTGEKYVCTQIKGTFSNSATSGSPLNIDLFVKRNRFDEVYVEIKFDEYGNKVINEENNSLCPYWVGYGSIIVVRDLRKVYDYDGFRIADRETRKSITALDLLKQEYLLEFTVYGKNKLQYTYAINSKYINNALIKAGLQGLDE